MPKVLLTRTTKNHKNIPLFNFKHEYFRNSFYPSTVIQWNKVDDNIGNSNWLVLLKNKSLNLSEQVLTVQLMLTILMELISLQIYELD